MDLIWMGAPDAVLFRVCVETSDGIVKSRSWKLKLHLGRAEFLARGKYPHLEYLKMGWVWWSTQRGETESHANSMAWNPLCCILHLLPCSQVIAYCIWFLFLLLHLSHFTWIAQEPLSRRKVGMRFSSFCSSFHLLFECHMSGRFLLCRTRFKNTLWWSPFPMRLSPPGRSLSCPGGGEGCEYICVSQGLFPTKKHSFILILVWFGGHCLQH